MENEMVSGNCRTPFRFPKRDFYSTMNQPELNIGENWLFEF
jgi:hypothetical protein